MILPKTCHFSKTCLEFIYIVHINIMLWLMMQAQTLTLKNCKVVVAVGTLIPMVWHRCRLVDYSHPDTIGDAYLLCAMRHSYSYQEKLILAFLGFHAFTFSTLPQYCLLHSIASSMGVNREKMNWLARHSNHPSCVFWMHDLIQKTIMIFLSYSYGLPVNLHRNENRAWTSTCECATTWVHVQHWKSKFLIFRTAKG